MGPVHTDESMDPASIPDGRIHDPDRHQVQRCPQCRPPFSHPHLRQTLSPRVDGDPEVFEHRFEVLRVLSSLKEGKETHGDWSNFGLKTKAIKTRIQSRPHWERCPVYRNNWGRNRKKEFDWNACISTRSTSSQTVCTFDGLSAFLSLNEL